MAKRPYPKKAENERRITVSFSISGRTRKDLAQKLARYMHTEPTTKEIEAFARGKAYDAIEAYITEPFVPDDEE